MDEWRYLVLFDYSISFYSLLNQVEQSVVQLQKIKDDFRRGDSSKYTLQNTDLNKEINPTTFKVGF